LNSKNKFDLNRGIRRGFFSLFRKRVLLLARIQMGNSPETAGARNSRSIPATAARRGAAMADAAAI
jgi:hypothetical protein